MMTVCIVIDAMIRKHTSELCYFICFDAYKFFLLDIFGVIVLIFINSIMVTFDNRFSCKVA